jgi:hypothetical protein
VGAADGGNPTIVENGEEPATDVGEPGVHQQATHQIGRDLEAEHPRPPARHPDSGDAPADTVGPDPGSLQDIPRSFRRTLPHLVILRQPAAIRAPVEPAAVPHWSFDLSWKDEQV